MSKGLNRRDFLKGAVAVTASAAAAAVLGGCDQAASAGSSTSGAASGSAAASSAAQTEAAAGPYLEYDLCGKLSMSEFEASTAQAQPVESFDEEESYDVVVIGAGASGLPAAEGVHRHQPGLGLLYPGRRAHQRGGQDRPFVRSAQVVQLPVQL